MGRFKVPAPLSVGDKIAIVSPAGAVNPDFVEGAKTVLQSCGFNPVVSANALGCEGTFAGSAEARIADMRRAMTDPETRAILCSRGGYGAVHLLESLDDPALFADPKWLIGFSDISALHALFSRHGVVSLHASMAKHLALHGADNGQSQRLFSILRGGEPEYHEMSHPFNREGLADGRLAGGNMAVLSALAGTRFNLLRKDSILFIEDINEPIYKLERIMWQLRLSGVLGSLRGLVVGQFTGTASDRNYESPEAMIRQMVEPYGYPVCFGMPVGHIDCNIPLLESASTRLVVSPGEVVLSQKQK